MPVRSRPQRPSGLALTMCAAATLAALAGAAPLRAQEDRLQQVDSILDRLEKRLLDREGDGFSYGEKLPPPEDTGPATTKYKFDPKDKDAKIHGKTPEQDQLKSLATQIAELETQVDQLASNVQKTKQSIQDEAGVDNFVSIEARLNDGDGDAAAIKTITVKIDGFEVYSLQEASGLWLPTAMLPLYAGPLQPGQHRVDLEARIVNKTGKALPMNGDVYRYVNKSFQVVIPGGTVSKRFVISIMPPGGAKGEGGATVDATIKEAL